MEVQVEEWGKVKQWTEVILEYGHWERADPGVRPQVEEAGDRVCQEIGKIWRNGGGSELDYKSDVDNTILIMPPPIMTHISGVSNQEPGSQKPVIYYLLYMWSHLILTKTLLYR